MSEKLLVENSSAEILKSLSKSAHSKKKGRKKEEAVKQETWVQELEAMEEEREEKIEIAAKRLQEGHYQNSAEALERLLDKLLS